MIKRKIQASSPSSQAEGRTFGQARKTMQYPEITMHVEAPVAPPITFEPIDPELRAELLTDVEERGQVTVHCNILTEHVELIRIWRSTFLVCAHSGHRSRLLHAEGIAYAPVWQAVDPGKPVVFTLLFESLPKECILFDMVEDIPQAGGFFVPTILRNDPDVYRVEV